MANDNSSIQDPPAKPQVSVEAEQAVEKISGQAARQVSATAEGGLRTLLAMAPTLPLAALGVLAIFAGLWWMEHDARLKREGELKEMQKQSATEISGLQAKADAAVRDANQSNARAASELEASRRLLEQQAQDLRQRLAALEQAEHTQIQQVAALPAAEIWKRLGEQLGAGAIGEKESEGVRSQKKVNQKAEVRMSRSPRRGRNQQPESETQTLNSALLTPVS